MERVVKGTFSISARPMSFKDDFSSDCEIGAMFFEKEFFGDLQATSKVRMMSAGDPKTGSAGYVAIECLTGQLDGHGGSFYMQHYGVMDKGKDLLQIDIVPGTGTDGFKGIAGTCTISIVAGRHYYELKYWFEE